MPFLRFDYLFIGKPFLFVVINYMSASLLCLRIPFFRRDDKPRFRHDIVTFMTYGRF